MLGMSGVLLQKTFVNGALVLAVCGGLHWLLAHALARHTLAFKTQPESAPREGDIRRDFFWASVTLFGFGSLSLPLMLWIHSYRPIMLNYDIAARPLLFLGTLAAFLFVVDTLRYWLHRALHRPFLFRHVHYLHHRTVTPTAFNGFSGHPAETGLNLLIPMLVMVAMPVHWAVPVTYSWFLTVGHVFRHLGYDFFSGSLERLPLLGSVVLGRFHDVHHTEPDTNFSTMFSWWDYWMGTAHEPWREPTS